MEGLDPSAVGILFLKRRVKSSSKISISFSYYVNLTLFLCYSEPSSTKIPHYSKTSSSSILLRYSIYSFVNSELANSSSTFYSSSFKSILAVCSAKLHYSFPTASSFSSKLSKFISTFLLAYSRYCNYRILITTVFSSFFIVISYFDIDTLSFTLTKLAR